MRKVAIWYRGGCLEWVCLRGCLRSRKKTLSQFLSSWAITLWCVETALMMSVHWSTLIAVSLPTKSNRFDRLGHWLRCRCGLAFKASESSFEGELWQRPIFKVFKNQPSLFCCWQKSVSPFSGLSSQNAPAALSNKSVSSSRISDKHSGVLPISPAERQLRAQHKAEELMKKSVNVMLKSK